MTVNMGTQAIATAPPPNTTVMDQPDSTSGPVQQMAIGGVGGLLKEVSLAANNTGPLSTVLQADPSLLASVDTIAAEVVTSGAPTNSAIEAALNGLFQEVPSIFLETVVDLTAGSGLLSDIGGKLISIGAIESNLSMFLTNLASTLDNITVPPPTQS
jgi:hypothetical protein